MSAYQSRPSPECSWPSILHVIVVTWERVVCLICTPKGWGCTYQANHLFLCYNCYVPWPFLMASIKQLMKNNWIPQWKATTLTINQAELSQCIIVKLNPKSQFYVLLYSSRDFRHFIVDRNLISGILSYGTFEINFISNLP